jgi:hypothetical protein
MGVRSLGGQAWLDRRGLPAGILYVNGAGLQANVLFCRYLGTPVLVSGRLLAFVDQSQSLGNCQEM